MHKTVQIASSADFPTATKAFMEMLYSGAAGELTVEIAPGSYETGALSLQDDMAEGELDLVIRGAEGAVFRGATLAVSGPNVRVEGLSFEGGSKLPARIGARRSATLSRLSVQGLRQGAGGGGSRTRTGAILLQAEGPGVTARVEDLWLVDNHAPAGGLTLGGQGGGGFAEVAIARLVASPGQGPVLSGLVPASIQASETIAVLGLGQALFAPSSPKATLAVSGSHLFTPRTADLVQPATSPQQLDVEFLPVTAQDTVVYAMAEVEAAVELMPSEQRDWSGEIADPSGFVAGAGKGATVDLGVVLAAVRGD